MPRFTAVTANCCTIFLTSSVNARGIPTNGNAAHTQSGDTGHGTSLPSRGFTTIWPPLQPQYKTGAEAIYALAMQIPGFRQKMNDGWYQIRIAGQDVNEASVSARLHESLPDGAIIHIVPRMAGAGKGGLFRVVLGAVAIGASF